MSASKLKGIKFTYLVNPSSDEINKIIEKYDLHEIIEEDLSEKNIHDKVDVYDDVLFIVCHFPKFGGVNYYLNEFKIILGKDFIIVFSSIQSNRIQKIIDEIAQEKIEQDEKYKISPYYVLYRFWDEMYDKVIKHISNFNKDMINIEQDIYDAKFTKELLSRIVQKRKNVSFMKHNLVLHDELLEDIQKATIKIYHGELEVYFEDLISKLDKINTSLSISSANAQSLMDSYNLLISIQTNVSIKVLTLFTVFMGMVSMISGIFGMNFVFPYQNHVYGALIPLGIMISVILVVIIFFKRKDIF